MVYEVAEGDAGTAKVSGFAGARTSASDATRHPNFFIVGAPKCATTSMDWYLSQHPDVFMANEKETHFFADDLFPPSTKCSWEKYNSFFDAAGHESIIGESSVFYLMSQTAAQAIHDFAPDAKILIMLRNPIDLIASHHSQIVYEGYEQETSLERALALEPSRRAAHGDDTVGILEKVKHYRDVVAFTDQINRYLTVFPTRQVHIVLYDDIIADVADVYRDVLQFLEIDPTFQPKFVVQNANKVTRNARLQDFIVNTPDWGTRVGRLILPARGLRKGVKRVFKRFNTRYVKRETMPPALREQLAAELRPEVSRLSTLLDRDLTHWCR